jgi:integrase
MAAGIYKRGGSPYLWIWWTVPVKDPKTGKPRLKKRYVSTKETEENQHVRRQLANKIKESELTKPIFDLPDPSYEEVRDAWLAHREAVLSAKGLTLDRLKDGTPYFAGRRYLDEHFAGWRAKSIDTPDIEKLQQKLLRQGLGNGIDRMVAALRAMLRYAVDQKRLAKEQLPHRFPMVRKKRKQPFSIPEKFYKPLRDAMPDPYKNPFTIAFWTGMRLSEVSRLRWSHVFLAKKHLYFPSAKTGDWRRTPLFKETLKILKGLKPGKPDDLVFPHFGDRTDSARAWRRAAVAVGLGHWHCRKCSAQLTDLTCPEHGKLDERRAKYMGPLFTHTRHSFHRMATNKGVPLVRAMQMTGHKHIPTHLGYDFAEESDLEAIRKAFGD